MAMTGSKSPEFKLTQITAGVGVLGVLIEMLRGGNALTENVRIAIIIAVTLIGASFVLSRGMSKYEYIKQGSPAPTSDGMTSELKVTAALSGAGVLPFLMELLQGGNTMSDKMKITLVGCVALLAIIFNASRGLAQYEHRGEPFTTPDGASPRV